MSSAFGHAEAELAIPVDPALRGAVFCGQAAVLDPQGILGVALSQGLRLVVGDG